MENSNRVTVKRVVVGDAKENCYVLVCPEARESIIIDPGASADKILRRTKDTTVRYILLTHGHRDHVGALVDVVAATHAPVAYHEGDANRMPVPADISLNDGDRLSFCGGELRVVHSPGHTPGSVSFLLDNWLFGGDTVFPGGPGNTKSPEDFKQIVRSIVDKIMPLPPRTRVFNGHGLSATVSRVRQEYEAFTRRTDTEGLYGDVLWLG